MRDWRLGERAGGGLVSAAMSGLSLAQRFVVWVVVLFWREVLR